MQVKLCIHRGFQRLRGDSSLFFSGLFGNYVMALIIGSIFYNLDDTTGSFFSRGALLFFAILMNGFSSALEVRYFSSVPIHALIFFVDSNAFRTTPYRRETFTYGAVSPNVRGYRVDDL